MFPTLPADAARRWCAVRAEELVAETHWLEMVQTVAMVALVLVVPRVVEMVQTRENRRTDGRRMSVVISRADGQWIKQN